MEINPTDNPDVTDRGVVQQPVDDVADEDRDREREEREEAVLNADDTGMLAQQREISIEEMENPGAMGTP